MTHADRKDRLRRDSLSRRDALDPGLRAQASLAVAGRVLDLPEIAAGDVVSGFLPIRSEIDTRPLLEALSQRGVALCLPNVEEGGLVFRAWRPGEPLVSVGFGLSAPPPDAPVVDPAIMLVPLAAFDRRGGRIGYGKGHYDRAIAAHAGRSLRLTIGLAFAAQEADLIPLEAHDRRLDLVVTEAETIRIGGGGP